MSHLALYRTSLPSPSLNYILLLEMSFLICVCIEGSGVNGTESNQHQVKEWCAVSTVSSSSAL